MLSLYWLLHTVVLCQLCMTTSAVKLFSDENVKKVKDMAKSFGSKMKDEAKEFVRIVKDIEADKRSIAECIGRDLPFLCFILLNIVQKAEHKLFSLIYCKEKV
nr:uncharacterized protein LOC117683427 [Crassostrea gigas]